MHNAAKLAMFFGASVALTVAPLVAVMSALDAAATPAVEAPAVEAPQSTGHAPTLEAPPAAMPEVPYLAPVAKRHVAGKGQLETPDLDAAHVAMLMARPMVCGSVHQNYIGGYNADCN
jgi:hypothetical protein